MTESEGDDKKMGTRGDPRDGDRRERREMSTEWGSHPSKSTSLHRCGFSSLAGWIGNAVIPDLVKSGLPFTAFRPSLAKEKRESQTVIEACVM